LSGFNQWLPFFEESSERRDVRSWNEHLRKHLLDKFSTHFETNKIKIVGLVSDRAAALIKLGNAAYLNVCSMPDLFHFMQDIGHLAGMKIGKIYKKACVQTMELKQKTTELTEEEQAIFKQTDQIIEVYQSYREVTRGINQTIHPFNELNEWTESAIMNKSLLQSICKIGHLAQNIGITVDTAKTTKILRQIPDIVKGVENWTKNNRTKIDNWVTNEVITEVESVWFERFLLPTVYFELQLERTKNGRTNHKLVAYYEKRVTENKSKVFEFLQQEEILASRQEVLWEMAYQMASRVLGTTVFFTSGRTKCLPRNLGGIFGFCPSWTKGNSKR
jgi:hypothetical protein